MRTVYRRNPETGKFHVTHRELGEPIPMVQPDIQPYRSMQTGEMITDRRSHREHLKKHGLQEVGNEKPKPHKVDQTVSGVRDDIMEAKRQLTWGEAPTLERLRDMTPHKLREMGLGD